VNENRKKWAGINGRTRTKKISQHAVTEDSYPCGYGRFMGQAGRRLLLSRLLKIFTNKKFYKGVHAVCK